MLVCMYSVLYIDVYIVCINDVSISYTNEDIRYFLLFYTFRWIGTANPFIFCLTGLREREIHPTRHGVASASQFLYSL